MGVLAAGALRNVEIIMNGISTAGGSSNRFWAFVFNYRRLATVPALSKSHVESAFQSQMAVPITAALNNRYAQSNNALRFVDDALDAPVQFSRAVPGAVTGDSMSSAESAFILMRTGLRGKSFRGGKHFGPMSESDTTAPDSDVFNAAALARLATVASAMLAGFTDSDGNVWVPTVLSRRLSQLIVNPTIVEANDVVGTAVNKRVGTMRHRKVASVY